MKELVSYVKNELKTTSYITNIFSKLFNIFFGSIKIKGIGNKVGVKYIFLYNSKIVVYGDFNEIRFTKNTILKNCEIKIYGNNNIIEIGEGSRLTKAKIHCENNKSNISIGKNFSIEGGLIASGENNNSIKIGNDCMFSENIQIRNTDSHWIICRETNEILNRGKNIEIEDHVWIGANSKILKGVKIGKESVIGIGSIITKDIESNVVVCEKNLVIRKNINWLRERI